MALPTTTIEIGGKEVEVITLEDKGTKIHSFEVLFLDKATQANIATYAVNHRASRKRASSMTSPPFSTPRSPISNGSPESEKARYAKGSILIKDRAF